jgi:hypothetical protein
VISLWAHIYGEKPGVLALFSGARPEPGSRELVDTRSAYFDSPHERDLALAWIKHEASTGREVYHCAHLLRGRRRVKENAATILSLWVDGDGAKVAPSMVSPTAVVESSPGREQLYWRLRAPVAPEVGEQLNRRLAMAMGADESGWDLTQLLRPPGTPNFKYERVPLVRILELKDKQHDPAELDRLLPPLPKDEPKEAARRSYRPKDLGAAPELSRLSQRMQDLIRYGNRGEYRCRSRADMAACVAMFVVGYTETEVWAAMADPTNGISEKFLEKGRYGERYLALTIGKAKAQAQASSYLRPGKLYTRRKGEVSLG